MTAKWRIALLTAAAVLAGAATSRADEIAQQPKEGKKVAPKKELKKEPPKKDVLIEIGKDPKREIRVEVREVRNAAPIGPIGIAHGVWPGPVLPGMWGGVWGALWPNSWWLGGPYLYSGWAGPWNAGLARNYGPYPYDEKCAISCCFSGAHPWLLPPVFHNYQYPAMSPYWVPRQPVYWVGAAAAPPHVLGGVPAPAVAPTPVIVPNPRSIRVVPVPAKASAERLYLDAVVLYFEDNFESSRNYLAEAVKQSPRDARLWYYKALAEKGMGDEKAARTSAEKGAALEILGHTEKRTILLSLERIQGADRKFISDLVSGPKALSLQSAADIVATLKASEPTTVTSAK